MGGWGELKGQWGELKGEWGELMGKWGELNGGWGKLMGEWGEWKEGWGELMGGLWNYAMVGYRTMLLWGGLKDLADVRKAPCPLWSAWGRPPPLPSLRMSIMDSPIAFF